ncbi:MAG: hypothetical protein ACJAZ9_001655 [Neolewinella sp.]|jgi:hypothetical protein
MATNPELELAFDYVSQTKRHVFLTGKAGTGKTTFLHRVRREVPKRMAVVAPTGVAAINAKGVTIHSLFQLPFGVILPGATTEKARRFSAKKIELLKSLDLLVIDEISMVRADVLDGIDEVLRRIRRNNDPFGGLQLLMIGDLHQLPPVVRDSDWDQMRGHYDTAYFFGSKALRNAHSATIQLKHIYRQSDDVFIGLLNKVRNNQMDDSVYETLNQRYIAGFDPADDEGYITLSSHNNTARHLNAKKLERLAGKQYHFEAKVRDNFPESMFPNTQHLNFKVGAQVMFNKNDTVDKLYFNGKIGKVTKVEKDVITVLCPGEDRPILVLPVDWENRKFEMNTKTKEVEDDVIGTYTQHPLKLAWAITIHKSQGLTFDKVIIDAADAFAHGQVYVALSRCKTFEGIVLRSKIGGSSVRTDTVVKSYSKKAEENQPSEENLLVDKRIFQIDCLKELFAGKQLQQASTRLQRALLENERWLQGNATAPFVRLHGEVNEKIITVGRKFLPHIDIYGREAELPAQNAGLKTRLSGAADYFLKYLNEELIPGLDDLEIMSDNKKIMKNVTERYDEMKQISFVTKQLFMVIKEDFNPTAFVRARADASIDYNQANRPAKKARASKIPTQIPHPLLYKAIKAWREERATKEETTASKVLSTGAMLEINYVLPTVKKTLLRVKGFGARRYEQVGEELLEMVNIYLKDKDLKTDNLEHAKGASEKEDTKQVSLELYKGGKTVPQVAAARKMAESTIQGHLAHWIALGDVAATDFIKQEDLDILVEYCTGKIEINFKEAVVFFKEKYSYGELRIGKAHETYLRVVAE